MGTNTDPYQRCEGKYRLTRGLLEVLAAAGNPFSILTKSPLVLRDTDVLLEAAGRTEFTVNFSIGTLDDKVWRASEPGTPHPRRRVEAVRRLADVGIRCGVLVAPVIPGMSDGEEQLADVVAAVVEAGARSVSAMYLHLRPGVREHYFGWLRDARPDLVADYTRRYRRAYVEAGEQRDLGERVRALVAAAGGLSCAVTETRAMPPAGMRAGVSRR
jgi:DNA repair photolyase